MEVGENIYEQPDDQPSYHRVQDGSDGLSRVRPPLGVSTAAMPRGGNHWHLQRLGLSMVILHGLQAKGGGIPHISNLSVGQFYIATEGSTFRQIRTPICLSHHSSPLTEEEVITRARRA